MKVFVFRSDKVKIGSFVDIIDDTLELPTAIIDTLGGYIVTWVQHKVFDTSEMMIAKVELVD